MLLFEQMVMQLCNSVNIKLVINYLKTVLQPCC